MTVIRGPRCSGDVCSGPARVVQPRAVWARFQYGCWRGVRWAGWCASRFWSVSSRRFRSPSRSPGRPEGVTPSSAGAAARDLASCGPEGTLKPRNFGICAVGFVCLITLAAACGHNKPDDGGGSGGNATGGAKASGGAGGGAGKAGTGGTAGGGGSAGSAGAAGGRGGNSTGGAGGSAGASGRGGGSTGGAGGGAGRGGNAGGTAGAGGNAGGAGGRAMADVVPTTYVAVAPAMVPTFGT
jgi:hypothetical protein